MNTQPTKGAKECPTGWTRSGPRLWGIRAVVHLTPLIASWFVVQAVSDHLWRSPGLLGLAAWAIQAIVIASVTAASVERVSRRLLPLAFLFELTLDFPDKAPSRFSLALRSGTINKLARDPKGLERVLDRGDRQKSAEIAIALVAAMSQHDRRTRGHAERVRAYADMIAQEMGLTGTERNHLAWGALLHDIGKLAVPETVLNKKEKLTEEEWGVLQTHPAEGSVMMAPMSEFLGEWGLAAGQHHERWDGNGYPLGLVGKEISLAGRITAVADTYDVITATRSYRNPMSHAAARQELVRCSGSQFDPDVVRSMLNVAVGSKWRAGPLAWVTEVPSLLRLSNAVSSVPSVVAATGLAATAVVAPTVDLAPPETVAFVETAERVVVTNSILATGENTTTTTVPASTSGPSSTEESKRSTSTMATTGEAPTSSATTTSSPTTQPPTTSGGLATTSTSSPASTTSSPTTTSNQSTTSTSSSEASSTSSSETTSTTTASPSTVLLYLANPGTGNTASSADLPLTPNHDGGLLVPNYDTDRNSDHGLTVKKDGAGFDTSDLTKRQDWVFTFASATTVDGDINLAVWTRANSGHNDIGIAARLQLCNPACVDLGSDNWSREDVGWWKKATLDLGPTSFAAQPGDILRLRLVVPDDMSEDDVRLAYDTNTVPAQLRIG